MRRETDLQFFRDNYPDRVIRTVRIVASESARSERGFVYTAGVDDAESECGLDHIPDWDYVIRNDGGAPGCSALETDLSRMTLELSLTS